MNQRKIGTVLSYLHILISNSVSIIYTPYMLRMLGQSEYGIYGTANSVISYLSILGFGIGGAYIRYNVIFRSRHDEEGEKRLNGMFLVIQTVLAMMVFIGGIFLVVLSDYLFGNTYTEHELTEIKIIMILLVLNMMVSFIFNVVMMALQAYEQFFVIRFVLLIVAVLTPVVNVIALRCGGKAIAITAVSLSFSVLTYLFFYIYARKMIALRFSFRSFDRGLMKELFVFSGFLFLNSITEQITFSTDNVVLSSVKGPIIAAVYSVGANFKAYFLNFSSSVSSVFAPQVNHIIATRRAMEELDELFIKVGRIQFYIVSLILIGYGAIGRGFVCLWAGENYVDAYYIGLLLMLAVFIPAFQNVGLEIQKALNKHKARSVVYFLVALMNVGITIPFSSWWGGIGAALATTVCMFCGTGVFMNWYYATHIGLNMIRFWKSIASILPGYILPVIVGAAIHQFWEMDSYYDVLGAAIVISASFAASVWKISMNQYEKGLIIRPVKKLLVRK